MADYKTISTKTAQNIKTIATSLNLTSVTEMSLPEIEAVAGLVARVVPAGNVPGVILNGLARMSGRQVPPETVRRDIRLLFKGVEQALDRTMYMAVFAGPAAVLWGYQNLLKLVGRSPEAAFPEGTWQFYADYALREDTARHANETHGFDTALQQHGIQLSLVDRLTAWVMTAIHTLYSYDELLANEWFERVALTLLAEVTAGQPDAEKYRRLYSDWQKQIPYRRGAEAAGQTYPAYRRACFNRFIIEATTDLPVQLHKTWRERLRGAETDRLPAYQRQLSILAYLKSESYNENRVRIPFENAHVGIIYQGRYYLLRVSVPESDQPAGAAAVRAQLANLVTHPDDAPPSGLISFARLSRLTLADLRGKFSPPLAHTLNVLRFTPILLNFDRRPRALPLAEIRQAERGIGDHPLTIFDTGETFVFDQSHIFFDGGWGVALAEIMTNEALAWAVYLNSQPLPQTFGPRPHRLSFNFHPADLELIRAAPRVSAEACAQTEIANLSTLLKLRKIFKQRSDLLTLTVNDLLVLYRAIHAFTYQPDPILLNELQELAARSETQAAARSTLDLLGALRETNPALLIPVDASQKDPRQRLYPMSFEVPLVDLDILALHQKTLLALNSPPGAADFEHLRKFYLGTLAGFGAILNKYKQIALRGEAVSEGSIRMLAHLPTPIQRLLDKVPHNFDLLNDLLKGREVFSNVGAVAPGSTLTRFHTAKDDNEKKTLAWGFLTDAQGVMRITLRDFRPHVGLLEAIGRKDLAYRLTQHYLDAYALGFNRYIADLYMITSAASQATKVV